MMRIRSTVRECSQHNLPTEQFKVKCLMLHRMKNTEAQDPKDVSAFILTKQTPQLIIEVIKQQTIRNDLTLIGFSMVTEVLRIREIPIFGVIFAKNLAKIEDFEGFAAITDIATMSSEQVEQIRQFFLTILSIIRTKHFPELSLVAFRFFRDCNNFPSIEEEFLESALELLDKDQERYPVFSVAMSLIRQITKISEPLRQFSVDKPLTFMYYS